ncbi:hypothetical protein [Bacteroides acidifaciens]|uniref:hypothetical protein n=1 Tax=Bacteroides acidifaciens TaxID=85831 RepID=UPI00158AC018|nr:hypothetical protein [Bacteroides acidifaciens]
MKTSNRNIYNFLIVFALLFSFYGCSSDEDEQQESQLPTFKSFQGTFSPISGNGEYVDGVWHSEVVCSAIILDNGGSPIIEYGFCWVKNTTDTPSLENGEKIVVGTDNFIGSYSAKLLVELYKNYNVRAYAINSSGVSYDDMKLARGGSISPR